MSDTVILQALQAAQASQAQATLAAATAATDAAKAVAAIAAASFASMDRKFEVIGEKIDVLRGSTEVRHNDCMSAMGAHGERIAKLEEKAKAAHTRLDALPVTVKGTFSWREWLALALAGGAGIGAGIKAFFFSGGK